MHNREREILWSRPVVGVRNLVEDINGNLFEEIQFYEINTESFANISPEFQGEALCFIYDLVASRANLNIGLCNEIHEIDGETMSQRNKENIPELNNKLEKYREGLVFSLARSKQVFD